MAATIKINSDDYIKLFKQYSAEEQQKIIDNLLTFLKPKGKKKETQKLPKKEKYKFSVEEILGEHQGKVPSIGNIDKFAEKHKIDLDKFEPISKLFEDAPPAEELVKMLTK